MKALVKIKGSRNREVLSIKFERALAFEAFEVIVVQCRPGLRLELTVIPRSNKYSQEDMD